MHRGTAFTLLVLALLAGACETVGHQLPQLPPPPAPTPPGPVSMNATGQPAPMGPGAVTLIPGRTRGVTTLSGNLIAPVRVQIGPQPFVVESCSMKPGDAVRIAIREPEGDAVLFTREYRLSGGLSTVSSTEGEWTPPPGAYQAELWVNGTLLDSRPFTVN
jgi:hypothetical protein